MPSSPHICIRRSHERGHANHGWLDTYHSFSFAGYIDRAHMGFRSLRVINQDIVAPNGGFPTHPHDNMEIFSYVLSGALSHADSMGNRKTLHPGEIQLMSAGSGITHSEFNHSDQHPVELLQIWLHPHTRNLPPSYTEWKPTPEQSAAAKTLLISPDGREHSATIHQDAYIYRLKLAAGESLSHLLVPERGAWLQVIRGELLLNDVALSAGDAGSTEDAGALKITAQTDTEALLFDLA